MKPLLSKAEALAASVSRPFFLQTFFWGMLEESGSDGKGGTYRKGPQIEMQRIQSVMITVYLSTAKQHAGIFRYFGSFI